MKKLVIIVIVFFAMILLGVIVDSALRGDLTFAPNFQLGDGSRTEPSDIITYGPVVVYIIAIGLIVYLKSKKKQRVEAEEREEERRAIDNAPIKTTSATIISKLQEKRVIGGDGFVDTHYSYFIAFEFPNKRREKTAVSKEQYALIQEGETGVFRYKQLGTAILFVDFRPHS